MRGCARPRTLVCAARHRDPGPLPAGRCLRVPGTGLGGEIRARREAFLPPSPPPRAAGGPGQGDPAGGGEGSPPAPPPRPPPSSRSSGLFLWARAPGPLPGLPRGRDILGSPAPPRPAPGCVLALPSSRGRGRGGVREDAAEEDARGSAAARRPPSLPRPSLPVPAPRGRAALPSPSLGPAPAPAAPSPDAHAPPGSWRPGPGAAAVRGVLLGGRERASERGEGWRPPPAPLLLALLRGRRALLPPPLSSLLPPARRPSL